MADAKNMDMDIVVQSSGIDTTTAQFNELIKTIGKVTEQVGRLSSRITVLMRNFSKLNNTIPKSKAGSSTAKQNNKLYDIEGFVKEPKYSKGYLENIKYQTFDKSSIQKTYSLYNEKIDKANRLTKLFNANLYNTGNISESASDSLWNFVKRVKSLTYTIALAKKLASVVNSLVQESGTWIENLNLFAVTFGESNYRDALEWATNYADKLGIANNEIIRMTGYFKQLSTAIGITGEQGTQLSQILTQLGYDFGSFYNISFGSAFEKLQAGIFSGQVRTLRTLGIDVSQASVQNLLDTSSALNKFNASATQLTQTQKVLARTILTMQAGTNAFGDLARSMDTLQNRVRILQASFDNLKLALGDLLSEFARKFIAYGIAIVQVITEIVRAIAPLKRELTYDIGDTAFTEMAEDAEEAEQSINQLPFDKWQSLTSGDNEQVNLTEALNQLLQEQIEKYQTISSQFSGIDEEVENIKNKMLDFIFPDRTEESLGEVNIKLKLIFATLSAIIGLGIGAKIVSVVTNVTKLTSTVSQLSLLFKASSILGFSDGLKYVNMELNSTGTAMSGIIKLLNVIKSHPIIMIIGIVIGLLTYLYTSNEAFRESINNLFKSLEPLLSLLGSFLSMILDIIGEALEPVIKLLAFILTNIVKQITFSISSIVLALVPLAFMLELIIKLVQSVVTLISDLLTFNWGAIGKNQEKIWSSWKSVDFAKGAWGNFKSSFTGMFSGYATGGIPAKSELFYMNENGVPEALINTGGRETNVINMDQLAEGMRRGFVQAIYETGLNDKANITIRLDGNINDSALARAIFPALKAESKRRGGNQL